LLRQKLPAQARKCVPKGYLRKAKRIAPFLWNGLYPKSFGPKKFEPPYWGDTPKKVRGALGLTRCV